VNMFTKNLGCVKFLKFREQLGLEFYLPKWLTQIRLKRFWLH
jgi:hypothetical protein